MKLHRIACGIVVAVLPLVVAAGAHNSAAATAASAVGAFIQQGPPLSVSGTQSFGLAVAVSSDGNTALVGAPNDTIFTGAAYVFTRSGSTWTQQGPKLVPSDFASVGGNDYFGGSVALSADGNTALIGAQNDTPDGLGQGAAWIFTRTGTTWSQQSPRLTPSDETSFGEFGQSVSLSSDGNTALIAAPRDNSGVGAAWIFARSGGTWTQHGSKLTASDESGSALFGFAAALSGDGSTALIGGPQDASNIGAAWAFTQSGGSWAQQGAKLTGGSEGPQGGFGTSVALSADGDTALVGGAGGGLSLVPDQTGAAWGFARNAGAWAQQDAKITPSDESGQGDFGFGVALSADGNTAIIGAPADAGAAGAAWNFDRSASMWTQQGPKLTASGQTIPTGFGLAVALSADASTALIGGHAGALGGVWPFVASGVSVTPASGGSALSADTTAGAYTALAGPVLSETAPALIGTGTIVLDAPSGFEFDASGTPACDGTSGLTASITAHSSSSITCTVTARSSGTAGTLTFSGITARPSAGAPLATGAITRMGTAALPGVTGGYGTLTETAGLPSNLAFTMQTAGAAVGSPLSPPPAVAIEDQFGNVTSSTSAVTVSLTAGTGTAGAVLSGASTRPGPVAAFSGLSIDRAGSGYTLTAASPGVAVATSAPFTVTASGGGGGGGGGGGSSGRLAINVSGLSTSAHQLVLSSQVSGLAPGDKPSSYTFTFGTDGAASVTCPAQDPSVTALVANDVDTVARVTLATTSGATATATTPIRLTAAANLPSYSLAGTSFGKTPGAAASLGQVQAVSYECTPAGGPPPAPGASASVNSVIAADNGPTDHGATAGSCFDTVTVGIVEGVGCFTQVDATHQLPPAEAQLLCTYEKACATIGRAAQGALLFNATGMPSNDVRAAASDVSSFGVDAIYYSTQPVRVDGVEIDPVDGGAVVLARAGMVRSNFWQRDGAYLVSSDAVVKIAGLPVSLHVPNYGSVLTQGKNTATCAQNLAAGNAGCLNSAQLPQVPNLNSLAPSVDGPIDLAVSPEDAGIELGEFTVPQNILPIPLIPDLPLTGTVKVNLESAQSASVSVHIALPGVLSDGAGHGLTGDTTLTVDNQQGLVLDLLHISVPSLAQLGLARLKNLEFTYSRPTSLFDGKATLDLSDAIQGVINAEVVFEHASFQHAHVDYTANQGGGYPLFGPTFLTYLGADLTLNPTTISGSGNISVGPALTSDGCGAFGAKGSATIAFGDPITLDLKGDTQILCANFGYSENFHADSNGLVGYGVGIDYPIPSFGSVRGSLQGQAYADLIRNVYHFQLDGNVNANFTIHECVITCVSTTLTAGADATWSDKGADLCSHISVLGQGFDVGAGIDNLQQVLTETLASGGTLTEAALLQNFQILASNCNVSQWQTLPAPRAPTGATAVTSSRSFTVSSGTKTSFVGLLGSGGAPAIDLVRPDGRHISVVANQGLTYTQGVLVVRQPGTNETLVELAQPEAGRWQVEAQPGSAPIKTAEVAHPVPAPTISATVVGRGASRALRYRITARHGDAITFLERVDRGAKVIGMARRATGEIRFTPSLGSAKARRIVAQIVRNGVVAEVRTVARYRPGRILPGRASHIRIVRSAGRSQVRFTPGRNTTGELITIHFADGGQVLLASKPGQRAITVASAVDRTAPTAVQLVGLRGVTRGSAVFMSARRRTR